MRLAEMDAVRTVVVVRDTMDSLYFIPPQSVQRKRSEPRRLELQAGIPTVEIRQAV